MHKAKVGSLVAHLELVPANPNEAVTSSQARPRLRPCEPVSEQGPATVVPAHTRTAVARLGIKIACDFAASPTTAPCACVLPSILLNSHDAIFAADCLVAKFNVSSWQIHPESLHEALATISEANIVVGVTAKRGPALMGPNVGEFSGIQIRQKAICMVVLRIAHGRRMAAFRMFIVMAGVALLHDARPS